MFIVDKRDIKITFEVFIHCLPAYTVYACVRLQKNFLVSTCPGLPYTCSLSYVRTVNPLSLLDTLVDHCDLTHTRSLSHYMYIVSPQPNLMSVGWKLRG
jgi:hypothetical protein